MSLLPWWDEPWADEISFDWEPDATIWAEEALTASAGAVWWSAAASVCDFDD